MLMKPVITDAEAIAERNELLDRAILLLKRKGWCQGQATNFWGNLCAIGALTLADIEVQQWAVHSSRSYGHAVDAVHMTIGNDCLPNWNDDLPFWGGKKKVIAAFEIAKLAPLGND